jgi:deoxyribonuclease-4
MIKIGPAGSGGLGNLKGIQKVARMKLDCMEVEKIGPAGSGGLGNLKGIQKVARMKLDCMEVEFTYGVRMSMPDARAVGALAKEKGVVLSVHAPYYINLASDEKEKIVASKKRILDSCERADALGARNVVFHAGFYQKKTGAQTYRLVKKAMLEIQRKINKKRWPVKLCPEITGKPSQFGSLEELLKLMQDTGCGICVDFAHLYARRPFPVLPTGRKASASI